ncbi:hypothetical protein LBMAG56_06570 [Verrucomicrobiota bacterium]|nr:hypothetical protein LBMAG56_06570 [Verrucomicrobiota bacterium]
MEPGSMRGFPQIQGDHRWGIGGMVAVEAGREAGAGTPGVRVQRSVNFQIGVWGWVGRAGREFGAPGWRHVFVSAGSGWEKGGQSLLTSSPTGIGRRRVWVGQRSGRVG